MATQTGSFDFKTAKAAKDEAEKTATNFITTMDSGGIMVHPAGDTTTGWKIGNALELLQSGISHLWAGILDSVTHFRLGLDNSAHIELTDDEMLFMNKDGATSARLASSSVHYFTHIMRGKTNALGSGTLALDPSISQTYVDIIIQISQDGPGSGSLGGRIESIGGTISGTTPRGISWSFTLDSLNQLSYYFASYEDFTVYYTAESTEPTFEVGANSIAGAPSSVAMGQGAKTNYSASSLITGYRGVGSAAFGQYNKYCQLPGEYEDEYNPYLFTIGNGTSDSDRSNAFQLTYEGEAEFAGRVYARGLTIRGSYAIGANDIFVNAGYDIDFDLGTTGTDADLRTALTALGWSDLI